MVRFLDSRGRLQAVEVQRSQRRPMVSAAHAALLAIGVVVTSYQVRPTAQGLEERFELSRSDGSELDEKLSQSARSALLPLALDED